jgi:hypothetical protein
MKRQSKLNWEATVVPVPAILGTYKKLEFPSYSEGFDKLYYVKLDENNSFKTEDLKDEIR